MIYSGLLNMLARRGFKFHLREVEQSTNELMPVHLAQEQRSKQSPVAETDSQVARNVL